MAPNTNSSLLWWGRSSALYFLTDLTRMGHLLLKQRSTSQIIVTNYELLLPPFQSTPLPATVPASFLITIPASILATPANGSYYYGAPALLSLILIANPQILEEEIMAPICYHTAGR